MDQQAWLRKNAPSLKGKTVAVTGTTGGLGRELCRGILMLEGELVLLNRDPGKSRDQKQALLREFPGARIREIPLELQDMASVKDACRRLQQLPVDILVHNAGVYDVPRFTCSTGCSNVFQINFLSPYYMTRVLLPHLARRGGKVAVMGSLAHRYSRSDPRDPDFSGRKSCALVYGNSKRYLMFALGELLQREPRVSFAVAHPGVTLTNISNHYPKLIWALIRRPMALCLMKPQKAARGMLLALGKEIPQGFWIGPPLLDTWGNPRIGRLTHCPRSESLALFRTAQALCDRL